MKPDAVADSSYLYALYNPNEKEHDLCSVASQFYPQALVSDVVLTEVAYLFTKSSEPSATAQFLRRFLQAKFILIRATRVDLARAAEILDFYQSRGTELDFVGACVVAVAERYKVEIVLTLDRRDFDIIRPKHRHRLQIQPD